MDYLVIEGYKSAAVEFSQEASLAAPVDFDSIENRMNIREALQRGDVEDAITRVNDLNPDVRTISDYVQRITTFMHHAQTLRVGDDTLYTKTSVFNMIHPSPPAVCLPIANLTSRS